MARLHTLADQILDRLASPAAAQAAPCDIQVTRCLQGGVNNCWYDQCTGVLYECYWTGRFC